MPRITISEVIQTFEESYKSIDWRIVLIKKETKWLHSMTFIRISHKRSEEVNKKLKVDKIDKNNVKFLARVTQFSQEEFTNISQMYLNKKIEIPELPPVELSKKIDITQLEGDFAENLNNRCSKNLREVPFFYLYQNDNFTGFDHETNRDFQSLGYNDASSAVKELFEIENQTSYPYGFYLQVYIPIVINKVKIKDKILNFNIVSDKNLMLRDFKIYLTIPNKIDREQFSFSKTKGNEKRSEVIYPFKKEIPELANKDRLKLSLVHQKLGRLQFFQRQACELMGLPEKNALFFLFQEFCPKEKFAQFVKTPEKPPTNPHNEKNAGRIFERTVSWLLSLLGFNVIKLDEYEKFNPKIKVELGGIDIIAGYSSNIIFLINCSLSYPNETDLKRMQNVVQKIREKISREYSQLEIYALEFVGAGTSNKLYKNKGIYIIEKNYIDKKMISYIENKNIENFILDLNKQFG